MKLLIINNIPTPYRIFMFNLLWEVGKEYDFNVDFFFQSRREKHRPWKPEDFLIRFPYTYSCKPFTHNPYEIFTRRTLNLDIIQKIIFGNYDFVMFAPSMSITNWIAAILPTVKANKLLYTESNLIALKNDNIFTRVIRRFIYSRFTATVCPGERAFGLVNYIAPVMEKRPNIFLPNIVDNEIFIEDGRKLRLRGEELRKELGLPVDKLIIISVGIAPCKGVSLALRTIALTPGNYLVLYLGDGPNREDLKSEAESKGISERVQFLGLQSEQNLLKYLAVADWFLHPAIYDASPLSCVEALSIGLPLAVSRQTGNSPEIIDNGKNGIIFDSDDPDDFVCALSRIVNSDETTRSKMGARSRELADERFNPTNVAHGFFKTLSKVSLCR